MRRLILFSLFFATVLLAEAQEINARISINTDKIQSTNKHIYETLQSSLTEFINHKKWTDKNYKSQERINCAFTIIINSQSGNQFNANLQVQATRPVYNTTYQTPILNLNDTHFNFEYNEFDPLIYNPTSFDSNLISTVVFYVYIILDMDANSFALNGGELYLNQAQNIALLAQQGSAEGWENQVGKVNRFTLVDNLRSSKLIAFKNSWYNYHRKGLDLFATDAKKAKQAVKNSIILLGSLYNKTIENYLIRLFLDAKSDEIINIFSDGHTTQNQGEMVEVLQKISPTNNSKWKKLN